jgi:HK97 gp10 family phage protein
MKEFSNLGEFGNHLEKLAVVGHEVIHHAVDQAGHLVEEAAQAEIGHYQPAAGPFPAWAPLADSTEAEKARLGYPTGAPLLRTGEMRDSIGHQTEGDRTVVGSNDQRMVYHEFGTNRIPPRPVLGPALFRNKTHIANGIGRIALAWLAGLRWKGLRLRLTGKVTHD